MATTETKTFYPKECEDYKVSDSNIGTPENPVGKGSNNTTYASLYAYWATSYAYWPFDASVIPEDAVIDSVECTAKAKINSTKYVNASLQLFSGDTAKGSATNFASTKEKVYSLTTGTWTRAELDSIRLKTEVDSTKANNRTLYFYGADLTVTYTYQSEKFMLKLSGAYNDVARTFKKVSGIWVEQTDLANVIEDGVRYKNGGEYVNPYKTVTITGYGYSSTCEVTINGVKYTSGAKVSALKNTIITLRVWGTSSLPGKIIIDGMKVSEESGFVTYNYTVTENIVLNLERYYISAEGMYQGTITITTQ